MQIISQEKKARPKTIYGALNNIDDEDNGEEDCSSDDDVFKIEPVSMWFCILCVS